jgi:hypothetical protein
MTIAQTRGGRVKLHIIAAALTFSMVACQLSTGGEIGPVVVRTDGSTFVLDDGVAGVPFTIENRGSLTIHLEHCGDRLMTAVNRWEGGEWVQYSGDACQTVYVMGSRPLDPGATISGGRSLSQTGRYRLRPVFPTETSRTRWKAVVSNDFTVAPPA